MAAIFSTYDVVDLFLRFLRLTEQFVKSLHKYFGLIRALKLEKVHDTFNQSTVISVPIYTEQYFFPYIKVQVGGNSV